MRKLSAVCTTVAAVVYTAGLLGGITPADAKTGHASGYRVIVRPNAHHDVSPPLGELPDSGTPGTAHPALRGQVAPSQQIVRAKNTSSRSRRPATPSPIANFEGITANGSAP